MIAHSQIQRYTHHVYLHQPSCKDFNFLDCGLCTASQVHHGQYLAQNSHTRSIRTRQNLISNCNAERSMNAVCLHQEKENIIYMKATVLFLDEVSHQFPTLSIDLLSLRIYWSIVDLFLGQLWLFIWVDYLSLTDQLLAKCKRSVAWP